VIIVNLIVILIVNIDNLNLYFFNLIKHLMRATSAKYTKVTTPQTETLKANEMRVSARGNIGVYVTRALELFDGSAE